MRSNFHGKIVLIGNVNMSIHKYIYKNGELTLTNKIKTDYGISFVRKYIDVNDNREYILAKYILQLQQQNFVNLENVVKILNVTKTYYDQEYLTNIEKINFSNTKHISDVKKAIKQLNDIGIIYLDLKKDNIGYSCQDKKWKIFDFDSSALYNNNEWLIKPPYYKEYLLHVSKDPFKIDNRMLDNLTTSSIRKTH
jgi:serine/threonine protein kinase